ncbi:MAG TPA: gamma-glutamyl-gamma-aminobutyrate hydrolase family protein, partial [Methylomirabilota bacterium]|nr:gamma-glutamyl-gamma-aminobutyrate hydrolase family protein [Methylomirabilota bacterium]
VSTSITVGEYPERAYVNSAYLRAVEQAGGVPVLLAPQLSAAARETLWARLDGLVLTGGGDLEPSRFGQPAHAATTLVSAARDDLELELVDRALRDDMPMFAICRGLQVLNVALGGSLHQHIPDAFAPGVEHAQQARRDVATHDVKVLAEDTRIGAIVGASELRVNSFHHQAIDRLGRDLREVAWAPDRVIEAVEHTDRRRFVLGVQWHPEDLVGHDAAARALFAAIVAAARGRGNR